MILYSILISLVILTIFTLSTPIRIHYNSPMLCYIYWMFIKVRIKRHKGNLKTDVKLFNRKTKLFSQKKQEKEKTEKAEKKKQKSKKKKRKFTFGLLQEIIQDKATKKTVRVLLNFLIRSIKSIKITLLNWDIGLKDYYRQGLIFGILHALPRSENFRISGNFSETNNFSLKLSISLWKLVLAVLILIIRFPYIRAFLLYRRVSIESG